MITTLVGICTRTASRFTTAIGAGCGWNRTDALIALTALGVTAAFMLAPFLSPGPWGWMNLQWLYLMATLTVIGVCLSNYGLPFKCLMSLIAISATLNNMAPLTANGMHYVMRDKFFLLCCVGLVSLSSIWRINCDHISKAFTTAFFVLLITAYVNMSYRWRHTEPLLLSAAVVIQPFIRQTFFKATSVVAIVAAALQFNSTTVYAAVVAVLGIEAAQNLGKRAWYLAWALPVAFLIGHTYVGGFYGGADRWEHYSQMLVKWMAMDAWAVWFGMGGGTFATWSTNMGPGAYNQFWLWGHSDWFQIMLEQGIVGFTAATAFWLWLVGRNWKLRPEVARAIAVYGVVMLPYFPLRNPYCLVIGMILLRLGGDKRVQTILG